MENPPRPRSSSSSSSRKRNTRFATDQDTTTTTTTTTGGRGDSSTFDCHCSGKQCRSCAASLIADCVAVCCCPLALVSLLALAFVKVPYLVGRRCLRRRKRRRAKKSKKVVAGVEPATDGTRGTLGPELGPRPSNGKSDIVFEFGGDDDDEDEEERRSFCAAFEADKVLMELYQVGHLGFGRVSFTGIQSFGKGN